jgi:NOL1/NOP2/sun family putative RNA methylase
VTIPYHPDFQTEIDRLLGLHSNDYWRVLETVRPYKGLRVNTLKTTPDTLQNYFPDLRFPVPWERDGFQITGEVSYSKHPLHSAGLYYLQEPSAMAPVRILDPQPGELILDLCAAPGGKSTQILSLMGNRGTLIANDPNITRLQALVRNIDRWGAHNTIITNESPKRMSGHFGAVFDRVLVDAPCSGEGMFRSHPVEIKKWSPSFRERCAALQDEILWFAGKLVRPGGILVYSTCTFNQLENEGSISRFLARNKNFSVDPIQEFSGFSPGIDYGIENQPDLNVTIRIWPHTAPGEGHYIARLKRSGNQQVKSPELQENKPLKHPGKIPHYQDFFDRVLKKTPTTQKLSLDSGSLALKGNQLYVIPSAGSAANGIRVERWGWLIGEVKADRFIPSPALAFGLSAEDAQIVIEFPVEDQDLRSYLRGSPISNQRFNFPEKAWGLVTVDGYPLGWGKASQGRIKSHFPRWLRIS